MIRFTSPEQFFQHDEEDPISPLENARHADVISSDQELEEGVRKGTESVTFRSERLRGNTGKLNAFDVIWSGVGKILRGDG